MKFPIIGATLNGISTTGTVYNTVSSSGIGWDVTETLRTQVLSEGFDLTDFTFYCQAPGVGTSRIFTIRKNGAGTAATVTIAGAATTATWSGTVSFAAGDLVSLEASITGTPAASTTNHWHITGSTTGQKTFLLSNSNNPTSNAAIRYIMPTATAAVSATVTDFELIMPTAGNLTNLQVWLNGAPGGAASYTTSVRLNNTSDNLGVTISAAAVSGNTTGSIAVVAGDILTIKISPSGTPTAREFATCVTFEPTTNGESVVGHSNAGTASSLLRYAYLNSGGQAYVTTEANVTLRVPTGTSIKNLYAVVATPPGAGTSRTLTVRDGGASTALTTTIANTNTSNSDTVNTVALTGGTSNVNFMSTVTGSVANTLMRLSAVLVTTQPAPPAASNVGATMLMMGV